MADIYLRSSDGNDADDGSTWALAKATMVAAETAAGAGGRVFASSNHLEASATNKIFTGGTVANPSRIYSVDDTGDPEPPTALLAGASLEATSLKDIIFNGHVYTNGVTFKGEQLDFSSADCKWVIENGKLLVNASVGAVIVGDAVLSCFLVLLDSDMELSGGVANKIRVQSGGRFLWHGGSLVGTIPTTLFDGQIRGGHASLRNIDLSTMSNNLIDGSGSDGTYQLTLTRCKLNSGLTILSSAIASAGAYNIRLHSCDSANTTYGVHEEYYEGSSVHETVIVRDLGATDGTTQVSNKMVTNANAKEFIQPLVSIPITKWTDATVSTTYTVEFIHDSLTNLQNDEIWMELEYPGADAQGDIANNGLSNHLATPANQATSAATWTTTGLTNPNEQKLPVTVTPAKKGPVTARVYLAKPSYTVYIDPKITES